MAAYRSTPARQTSLREHNLALLLGELADRGPTSRARLAASTGLTKATVSRLVDTLVEADLVADLGMTTDPVRRTVPPGDPGGVVPGQSLGPGSAVAGTVMPAVPVRSARVGRPGRAVGLSPWGPVGVGVEINVDYLAVCSVDLTGAVRHREVVVEDLREARVDGVLARVAEVLGRALDAAAASGRRVAGVCVAVPGLVEVVRAGDPVLRLAPNLGWQDVPVLAELRRQMNLAGIEMYLDNEANLAALGELWAGGHVVDGRPLRSFVHVSGEVGVGAGIVIDGRIYRGGHGFSGELGHLAVSRDGPPCACGSSGCLERVAGQEAILRAAGLALEPSTSIGRPAGSVARLLGQAAAGEERALSAIEVAGRALGTGIAAVVNLVDLHTVVLGGLYAALARWLREPVETELSRRVLSGRWAPVQLLVGGLVGEAAVRGAATSVVRTVIADPAHWLAVRG
jgi:predicted NBD/HSP70 family sugar kinase